MQKKTWWVAGLVVASAPAAFAQAGASVQVYGVADMAISSYRGEGAGSRQMLTSSGNQASRVGFRGKESFGNGRVAGFDLEAGLNTDAGSGQPTNTNNQPSGHAVGGITFNRKSFVYLGGPLGTVRLGRDYTPGFWNLFVYDPFRNGVGIGGLTTYGTTSTGFRSSNGVGYFSPGCTDFRCNGFFFQATVAFGENQGAETGRKDGTYTGWRAGYGGDGWDIAVADGTTRSDKAGDYVQRNIGGSYVWQSHRLMLLLGEHKTGNRLAAMNEADSMRFAQIGGWISLGKDYIPVSFTYLKRNDTADSRARKLSVGYVHTLSKRTALYGTYSYVSNGGLLRIPVSSGAEQGPLPIAGGKASGFDLGIRHNF